MLSEFVDATTARSVQAGGRWYYGNPVRGIDAALKTITIEDNRDGTKTFGVAQDACIAVDGKHCQLAAVPTGAFVNLGLAADQQTARFIGAEGPHLGGCGGSMVKAVNPSDYTITFDDKAHPSIAGKTYSVSPSANIVIDGKGGKLAEIPAGSYVNLTLSVDQQQAVQVHAQGPPLDCDCGGSMVKYVDPTNYTITFDEKTRGGVAGKTFTIAKEAQFTVDGRAGTLAEIPPGAYVSARCRVDKTIGMINANGPAFAGVLKAIDAANNSITVDNTTYPVAKNALIVIDGKQCPLSSMPTGANVNVNLRVDLKTVGMIQFRTS
jgi:hypothetical protein